MTGKIIRSILAVAVTVLIAAVVVITGVLYPYFNNMQAKQLRDELNIAAAATEQLGSEYITKLNLENYRITLIAPDGTVLYDTKANAGEMENHLDREEVRQALEIGRGSSSRYSSTLIENTLYEAVRLSDGTVLRLSVSQKTAAVMIVGMLQPIALITLVAILLSIVLAHSVSKRITEPLNKLDLENPLENEVYEELSPLLTRIHHQNGQIEWHLRQLKQRKKEFRAVTENMQEGLVLLDSEGRVLSINPAAARLLQTDENCVGEDFVTVDRRQDLNNAIKLAYDSGHGKLRAERGGRECQFDISRIETGGKTVGAVILCTDVTESAFAERNRQEFTANVSHELKTPLQSIIGSAELLENGLVKPEDMQRFVGHIRNEAERLVTLINDIIRLSQLDENGESPHELVSLYEVAAEVLEVLSPAAEKAGVTMSLSGEHLSISGERRYIYEIIYNLCDNAIRYNIKNGKVNVDITKNGNSTVLTVADTGIGIPPEHQSRVFERFYRVDKSHSKQTGGTGLGLSIVKHTVAYHGGRIELNSTVGKGTTIKIIF